MPIYEFYCDVCNTIFNFFSSRVNTEKIPPCPKCGKAQLDKKISTFATLRKIDSDGEQPEMAGFDETKMEHAFESLMRESEGINQDDPRQMAQLMRTFTSKTGISFGDAMEEAISRMEAGEDPEMVEKEMGDQLSEDDFSFETVKQKMQGKRRAPLHDEKLYEL